MHPCSDPSLPPAQPAPLARDSAPEELLRGLDVRAASPGREPRAASRPSTGLPLSARMPPVTGSSLSPGAAHSGLAHRAALPSPPLLSASACAARAAPRPLCPQLPLSPLLPLWNSQRGPRQPWGPCPRPDHGRLHLSWVPLPRQVGSWDGALCPAVLQRAQGRARVSPPWSSCSDLSVKRLREPSQFFMAPLPVARENTLYAQPLPFLQEPPRPWSACSSGGDNCGISRWPLRGWGAPERGTGWTPSLKLGDHGDSLYFSEPGFFL